MATVDEDERRPVLVERYIPRFPSTIVPVALVELGTGLGEPSRLSTTQPVSGLVHDLLAGAELR